MKFIFIFIVFINSLNAMNCSDYKEFKLFNGHYYTVSVNKLTFESAKQIAKNNGGYLAIPNSASENNFIKSLIGGGSIGWIGIEDPNKIQNFCYGSNCFYDSSRFRDVKGNSLLYKNFSINQPDNLVKEYDVVEGKQKVSPLGEHWVAMDGNNGKWFDDGNHADEYNNPVKYKAVFEFETLNECKPLADDGVQELTGRFCNTKVWDTTIDTVIVGKTLDCQIDKYGNEYCPSALSECGQEFDYENGYSVSGLGQVVDYTKIEAVSNNVVSGTANFNYSASFCTDHFTKVILVPDGNDVHFILVAQDPGGGTDGRCGYRDYSSSWLRSKGVAGWNVPTAFKRIKIVTFANPVYSVEGFKFTFSSYGNGCSNVSGSGTGNTSRSSSDPYAYGYAFDNRSLTNCGAKSAQTPTVNINFSSIYTRTLNCPDGYTETTGTETSKGQCKKTIEYTYYNYLCNNSKNEQGYNYTPINSGGNCTKTDSSNTTSNPELSNPCNNSTPPVNNCKREKFMCQANKDRPCSFVDNSWQCSPFPCLGQSNLESLDTQVGKDDKSNDGWSEDGSCAGTIYIFNGKSNKCRSWDMFFGLTGGGCCDKDKVAAGLVACKENEKMLAAKREKKQTHYIGNFCSKELKLGFTKICVQKSDSYCTFNSSLARIIQEQGREQLDISWGSAKSPECRGFTPEEFQKIDFSKIDLTEFVKDIQSSVQSSVIQNLGTYVKDKVGDFYGN